MGDARRTPRTITSTSPSGGERDIDAMVLRDRNHPSVIMWSIGNEIPERAQPRGVEIAKRSSSRIKMPGPDASRHGRDQRRARRGGSARSRVPVPGCRRLQLPRASVRSRITPAIPSASSWAPSRFRGQAFPSLAPVEKHPYVIGDFVWTGMDHLGESSIGNAQLNARCTTGGRARLPSAAGCAAGPAIEVAPGAPGRERASGLAGQRLEHQPAVSLVQLLLRRHRPDRPAQTAVVLPAGDLGAQHARDGRAAARSGRAHGGHQRVGLVRRTAQLDVARQRRQDPEGPRVLVGRPGPAAAERQGNRRQAGVRRTPR